MFAITIICVETSVKVCEKIQATAVYHDVLSQAGDDNWPLKCKDSARRQATNTFRDSSGSGNLVIVSSIFPNRPPLFYTLIYF